MAGGGGCKFGWSEGWIGGWKLSLLDGVGGACLRAILFLFFLETKISGLTSCR